MAVLVQRDAEGWEDRDRPVTRVISLRDGRRLAYTEVGDPEGVPIIHQHGMPGSRLEHQAELDFYRLIGVRVITPDRPGYGMSDPHPHRRLLDWPSDVAELADHLGIWRFGITGLSGGGIYALACAAAIPERLTEVVVSGCPAPMQREGALAGMRFMTRAGVWLGSHAPWLLDAGASVLSGLVRRYPRFFVEQANRDKPPADRRWLKMPAVSSGAVETLREAVRPGAWGYVQDVRVLARPWGFALDDIRVPVQLWHGDEDTVVPLHHGRYLASVIPGATLRVCPGEAHMVMWNHLAEILMAAAGMSEQGVRPAGASMRPAPAGSFDSAFRPGAQGHSSYLGIEVNEMFKHILVAIDGSTYSQQALPTAIAIARKFGSDAVVLHVSEHDRGRAVVYSLESPADATRLVYDAVKTVRDAGITATGELRDMAAGHVAKAIVETATAHNIDLIVMGSRGLSDVQGLLLGSVTHKVIQMAQVPVLVDRTPGVKELSAVPAREMTPALAG